MAEKNLSHHPSPVQSSPSSPYLYRTACGYATAESLRANLAGIAESLEALSEAIANHAIDLESMLPELPRAARQEEEVEA